MNTPEKIAIFKGHLKLLTSKLLLTGLITASVIVTGCVLVPGLKPPAASNITQQVMMTYDLTVFRSPTCGCCGQWIRHMETAGFHVQDTITKDTAAIKRQYGVPASLASCHTAIVDSYVVEGHIPAEDVQRLLTAKPEVAGIPGTAMPIGSPGMKSGDYVEPYAVFSFEEAGATAIFAEHP